MARASTIETLPNSVLAEVNRLLGEKVTLDRIVAHLRELGHPRSRSAVGRYKQNLDEIAADMRETDRITDALVKEIGPNAVEGKQIRLLIKLLQNQIFRDLTSGLDTDKVERSARDFMLLARAINDMARAQKTDADRELAIRRETAKSAAAKVDELAAGAGISKKTRDQWRREILGLGDLSGAIKAAADG